jgi:hypothetical protein
MSQNESMSVSSVRPAGSSVGSKHPPGQERAPVPLTALVRWSRRRATGALALVVIVLAVEAAFLFFVTAGTWTTWPTYNANYDLQAEGFRSGHLHLAATPPPELLAKSDPFNPANRALWAWDLSLYKGHYYMYWGPFPAIALAVVKAAFRLNSTIGDQYLVFAFYSIYLMCGAFLIERMARRLFPTVPVLLIVAAVLAFAFANPTPFLLSTAGIYQASIVGGQAFLVAGLLLAFDAIWKASVGRRPAWLLLGAGACWALAIACRVSTGPPVLLLTIGTAFFTGRNAPRRWRAVAWEMIWLGGPVAAGVFALLLYNKLRFDAWFEFGTSYHLSTLPFKTSLSYLADNAYSYLLRPMISSCKFPFFTAPWYIGDAQAFPRGFPVSDGYWVQEPLAGTLRAVPWSWFFPVGVFVWLRGLRRSRIFHRPAGSAEMPDASLWCGGAFAIVGTVTMLPVAGLFTATMRYAADVDGGVVLFATWTAFWLYSRARRRGWALRVGTGVVTSTLAIATVVLGSLLGFEGYDGQFRNNNPKFYERVVNAFSRCDGSK